MMQKLMVIFLASFLAACGSLPKHAETRSDQPTPIVLGSLPMGATVRVDGRPVYGTDEEGNLSVPVKAGMHSVEVSMGSTVIYQREVFLDEGTARIITVSN